MLLKYVPKVEHLKMVALSVVEDATPEKTLVQLTPGVNEVTEKDWKCMRPNIAKELESGEIVILAQKVSDGRGKPGGRKAKDLVEMPVNIAVTYIAECTNNETLVKWYKEETREEVRIHITKRLEKLGIGIPEDEIPDSPNASPMSLDEYENEDNENEEGNVQENTQESNTQENELPDDALNYDTMKRDELIAKAKELNINGVEALNKQQIIEKIKSVM